LPLLWTPAKVPSLSGGDDRIGGEPVEDDAED